MMGGEVDMLKRPLRGCVAALALLAAVGVGVLARGPCKITNSIVSCNTYDGVVLRDSARVTADGNRIVANARYGVALHDNSCDAPEGLFTGHITGASNVIPGPGTAGGNKKGAVFPGELEFLRTEDGGELDRCE